jgi:hypothetical protein
VIFFSCFSFSLKAVIGMDKYGIQIAPAKRENEPDFLKIDKNSDVLENFMSNFVRQMKNPTHFQFFKIPLDKLEETTKELQAALKTPEDPDSKALLNTHQVKTEVFAKQQANAIDENRIDWKQFERLGLTRENLEKNGNLDRLLNRQKTDLLPISLKLDDISLRTDARLGLREMPDGKLSVSIHAIRKESELDRYYFGVKFSEEDKQNLLKTGNLGRIAEVQYKQGETTPVLISLDRQTNELISVRADKIRIPENVKGIELNAAQKKDLSEGKAVWLENMTSKNGKEFSAYFQFNADKRSFEFRFDNEKQTQTGTERRPAQQFTGGQNCLCQWIGRQKRQTVQRVYHFG